MDETKKEYKDWTEMEHPLWGKGGHEEGANKVVRDNVFPTKIWRKGKFSIIPPCKVTMDAWELFDGNDIERFATFEEAKIHADNQPL